MLMTRENKETVMLLIENELDYLDLFANNVNDEDEFSFDLNAEVLDVFFPDWDTYIDEDSPFESLRIEDVETIKVIDIQIASDFQKIDDYGTGVYDVVSCECCLANVKQERPEEQADFMDFLNNTGKVTFKITPNRPILKKELPKALGEVELIIRKADNEISKIREKAALEIFNRLIDFYSNSIIPSLEFYQVDDYLEETVIPSSDFYQVGYSFQETIKNKSFNEILTVLDKIVIPKSFDLKFIEGEISSSMLYMPYGRSVSRDQIWGQNFKSIICMPNGEKDDDVLSHIQVEESLMGAWQALLLGNIYSFVPRLNYPNGAESQIFITKEEDLLQTDEPDSLSDGIDNLRDEESIDFSIKAVSFKDYFFISYCECNIFKSGIKEVYVIKRVTYLIQIKYSRIINFDLLQEDELKTFAKYYDDYL